MKSTAVLVLATVILAACGNPGGSDRVEFTFTPVPYKDYPALGRPVSVDENCHAYLADEVGVHAAPEGAAAVAAFLRDSGLEVGSPLNTVTGVYMTVRVPVGSVPDALKFITSNERVTLAEPSLIIGGHLGERLFGCKEVAG